jgi:hypothetical protein
MATMMSPRSLQKHNAEGVAFNFMTRFNRLLSSQIRTVPSKLAVANNLIFKQLLTLITSSLWSSSVGWSYRSNKQRKKKKFDYVLNVTDYKKTQQTNKRTILCESFSN